MSPTVAAFPSCARSARAAGSNAAPKTSGPGPAAPTPAPHSDRSHLPLNPASIPVHASAGAPPAPPRSSRSGHLLPLQCKLAIGSTTDPLETEADQVADQVMKMSASSPQLRGPAATPVLRRKCACEASGAECSECKKKKEEKLMLKAQSTSAQSPVEAPPIVHQVLRTPGQPLDGATRAFFEPRFQNSFAGVRVHHDAHAAESARQVHAHAYAVGQHLVFAEDQYRPQTAEGRRLIAHELSHVLQQSPEPVVRRDESDERGVGNPNSPLDKAYAAADAARWEEAAGYLKEQSEGTVVAWMYPFRNEPEKISFLYLGAIGNKSVGPDSGVAKATRAIHLDFKFKQEKHRGNWGAAGEYLNGFNHDDVMRRLKPLTTDEVRSIHDGALQTVGADSGAAKFTAEELNNRATKGDAAAAAPTSENVKPLSAEERKQKCQQGRPENNMIFPLRMPKGLWRIDVAPISARRDGDSILVSQPVNAVFGNSYFKSEVRTLPIQVFTGGIRLKPDEVVRVRLYDQEKGAGPIIRCVTGEQMLKISSATDTAVIVGIVDTALLAASVFVPGGGAAATRFAVGQVAANEIGDIAVQKAQVDAGIQDSVDWVGVGFDTVVQLVTLGFGGKLSKLALSKLEVIPEAGKFARPVLAWAIQSAISGAIFDFQALAHVILGQIRDGKKPINYGELIEQLALEFIKGALFHTIMSAAAQHEGGPPGSSVTGKGGENEPSHPVVTGDKAPVEKPTLPPADVTPTPKVQEAAPLTPRPKPKPRVAAPEPQDKAAATPDVVETPPLEAPVTKGKGAPSKPPAVDQTAGAQKAEQGAQEAEGKKPPPLPKTGAKKTLSADEIPWADDVGLAMIELDEAAANQQFDKWIKEDPQREVAIYKDPVSGEYILVQGKEHSVGLRDVVTDPTMRRNWIPIEHYHPGSNPVTRLASRADFRAMMAARGAGKPAAGPVSSRIRWTDARGNQHTTEYGYKPGEAQPYYLEFDDLDGRRTTKTFKEDPWKPGADYEEFLSDRGVAIARGGSQGQGSEGGSNGHPSATETDESADTGSQETPGGASPRTPKPRSRAGTGPPPIMVTGPGVVPEPRTAETGGISTITEQKDVFGLKETTVEGRLQAGMDRKVDAPNYNREWVRAELADDIAARLVRNGVPAPQARARAQAIAANYEAAHLWGPGFGDEAAAGMLWAPVEVNQMMQNRFAEKFARALREEAEAKNPASVVTVKATAVPFSRETLVAQGLPPNGQFLEHAQYKMTIQVPGEAPKEVLVTVKADPPGASAGGSIEFFPPDIANRFMKFFQ